MKTFTFKGGIYPPEHKELAEGKKITAAFPASKTLTIPITMGGAPNQPVVAVGDKVARGQVIAKSDAFVSAPVHSPVSGTVKKIVSNLSTANSEVPCIVIAADEDPNAGETFMPPLDPYSCSKEEALARVKDAGICGMGGASFPTHVKLNPPKDCKIDYVLLNAAECEPYLTVDEQTMDESADKVIDGLLIVQKIVGGKAKIVLESNKAHLIPKLEEAAKKTADSGKEKVEVVVVKTKYPQGAEKNVITAVTGREVKAGGLPASAGCVVCNVGTVCAISDAFRLGKPLIERAFTVSGLGVKEPKNLLVPIGTLVSDLIPSVIEVDEANVVKIISGGPMMGFSMQSAAFPVQKGTSGVLFLTKKEIDTAETNPCITCGACVHVCPMRLTPTLIVRSVDADDLASAKKYGLMDCIECGSCAYVCPATVRLVQTIRIGKNLERARIAAEKDAAAQKAAQAQNANGGAK
ncbi:MAG: electron transport complex subunit RsxC [Treponema sp.]|nr:electron transport complex subunit RsxC [Treponema sp.]